MSYAGEILIDELKNTGVSVAYGIDRNNGFVEIVHKDILYREKGMCIKLVTFAE